MARRHRIESPSDAAAGMSAPNTRPPPRPARGDPLQRRLGYIVAVSLVVYAVCYLLVTKPW